MKKVLTLLLSIALTVSLLAGCSGKTEKKGETLKNDITQKQEQKASEKTPTKSGDPEVLTLPIVNKPIKLTVFTDLSSRAAVSLKSYSEMAAFQELQKRTGIELEFRHPPAGQEKEQFNLMLAANDLTDLIYYTWSTDFVGGPEKALNDGIVLELSDYINKYSPNFHAILKEHPEVKKDSVTDTGKFYMYPLVRLDKSGRVSGGWQIRKDWLDKLGLKMPENIDEWYTVLKAFKEKDPNGNGKADEIPYISSKIKEINGVQQLAGAWGIGYAYYIVGNEVKYGPAQPEYREFLETMRKWYKEGLIDPDFLTTDRKNHDAKVTSGVAGAYYGLLNSYMGSYTKVMQTQDPSFQIVEAPLPIALDGKRYNFHDDASRAVSTQGFAISSKNKYPIETVKLLDYFYSEEGRVLMNLGIEGLTYNIVNGVPKYTELITKNPSGLPLDQAISHYTPAGTSARLYQDSRYWDQMMTYENQKEAIKILEQGSLERVLPPITPTPDESTRLAAIQSEINTYSDEMFAKFIMGQEDLSGFDKYIQTLKSLNLDEALDIQQKALERYQKRGN